MLRRRSIHPLREVLALDERVSRARQALQRTSDQDPSFERRIKVLVHLVEQREKALGRAGE